MTKRSKIMIIFISNVLLEKKVTLTCKLSNNKSQNLHHEKISLKFDKIYKCVKTLGIDDINPFKFAVIRIGNHNV